MATVMIWRPVLQRPDKASGSAGAKAGSMIRNVGHASLLTDRSAHKAYVSYWPSAPITLDSPAAPDFRTMSYEDDLAAEGAPPKATIALDSLDDESIASWWRGLVANHGYPGPYAMEYLPKDGTYNLWSTNCSTIVALAMKIGGAEKFIPVPKFDVITPMHIEAWARLIALRS